VSERFVCRVIGQHRTTQRLVPKTADDEAALTADIIELARQYGRYSPAHRGRQIMHGE
jgi:putative transposase